METKLNYKRTFLIGLAFLSICSFWQMYDNIIPLILQNTYHLGETMTGAVMALDNVLAIFLLPVFGTLSDTYEAWQKNALYRVGYDPGSDLHDVTADDRQCRKGKMGHCRVLQ